MENAAQTLVSGARASDTLPSLLRYKRWADEALIAGLLALPAPIQAPEAGYITAIIRHYHTVDCIFQAHLRGVPHAFTSPNPPEPATLEALQPRVRELDNWYVEYAHKLGPRELEEVLNVKYTDGAEQLLTRSDILLHVSQHGAGHRAQVALLMKLCGLEAPPDRFTNYVGSLA